MRVSDPAKARAHQESGLVLLQHQNAEDGGFHDGWNSSAFEMQLMSHDQFLSDIFDNWA